MQSWFMLRGMLIGTGMDHFALCLGNYSWGALTWPLVELSADSWALNFNENSQPTWVTVENPEDWHVIAWDAAFLDNGLCMQYRTVDERVHKERLVIACLLTPGHGLLKTDFLRLASHYNVEGVNDDTAFGALVKSVAEHLDDGEDPDFVQSVVANANAPSQNDQVEAMLLRDPLFESVFNDLDQDDQLEHSDILAS